jgi:hypothetical protein
MPAGLQCALTRKGKPWTRIPHFVRRLKRDAVSCRRMGSMNGAVPKPNASRYGFIRRTGPCSSSPDSSKRQPRPGKWQTTFTIITTAANRTLEPIHNRMPVILDEAAAADWMNMREPETLSLKRLLMPGPNDLLVVRPASPLVNSVKNEGPELLKDLSSGSV